MLNLASYRWDFMLESSAAGDAGIAETQRVIEIDKRCLHQHREAIGDAQRQRGAEPLQQPVKLVRDRSRMGGQLEAREWKEVKFMNGNEGLVTISGRAASKLREIAVEENMQGMSLRIAAVRTRCMGGRGYMYRLEFEDSPGPDDALSEHDGFRVCMDPASARYLKGSELDYVETLAETGFKIKNPNVVGKCPCGRHDIFENDTTGR